MNFRYTLNQFALLMSGLALLQAMIGIGAVIDALFGVPEEEPAPWALLASGVICGIGFGIMYRLTRTKRQSFGRREALLLVGTSWLVGAAVSGLPFFFWALLHRMITPGEAGIWQHAFLNPVNCYFEAMSGLTTTGATILRDIATVPQSLLLWRALTHWLGGLGIVVLFVAVLPNLGAGAKKLFRMEAPGPTKDAVMPSIREAARVLWYIYLALTVAQIIALTVAGLSVFDAICHTFATLATGGFSTHNASIGAYRSWAVDIIVIVFMFLAGVNFGVYYEALRGRLRGAMRNTEFRAYVLIMFTIAAVVVMSLYVAGGELHLTDGSTVDASLSESIRHGVFTTVSIQTTTGFCTADFDRWPFLAKSLLVLAMCIGASAGSTGGGLKVIRIWVVLKVLWAELERAYRPQVVRPIKVGSAPIEQDLRLNTVSYVLGVMMICVGGAILVGAMEAGNGANFVTALTASIACLFNIGPGLAGVGAVENYAWFTSFSKILLSVLMAAGRLEVFAIVVLFFPRFWSSD
jgi:trk system potassium uptake protein TrkH